MKYSAYTMIMPEFTTISECAQVLKGIGYDGIELWVGDPEKLSEKGPHAGKWRWADAGHIAPKRIVQTAEEIRRIVEDSGLEICGLSRHLSLGNREDLRRVCEGAKIMGCSHVGVAVPEYNRTRNYNELYAETTTALSQACRVAKESGVRLLLEMRMNSIIPRNSGVG